MLKTVFRFVLPGGRRLFVVYVPPKAEETHNARPLPCIDPPKFDRIFAQAGLHFDIPSAQHSSRGKRTS